MPKRKTSAGFAKTRTSPSDWLPPKNVLQQNHTSSPQAHAEQLRQLSELQEATLKPSTLISVFISIAESTINMLLSISSRPTPKTHRGWIKFASHHMISTWFQKKVGWGDH
jgi:hypothetical protein